MRNRVGKGEDEDGREGNIKIKKGKGEPGGENEKDEAASGEGFEEGFAFEFVEEIGKEGELDFEEDEGEENAEKREGKEEPGGDDLPL